MKSDPIFARNCLKIPFIFASLLISHAEAHPIDRYLYEATEQSEAVRRAEMERSRAQQARKRVIASFAPTPELSASYTRLSEPTTLDVDLGPIPLPAVEVPILGAIELPDMELDLPPFELSDENIWRASLSLTLPLFVGGQRLALLDATKQGIEARDLAKTAAERGTRLQIVLAYLRALEAQAIAQLWQERTEWHRQLLELTEQRAKAGGGVAIELDLARVQISDSERKQSEAESTLHRRSEELNHLTKRELSAPVELEPLDDSWFPMPEGDANERPDLAARQKAAQAQESQALAESRKLLPLLALQGEVGYKKGEPGYIDGSSYWQGSLVFRWNLMADWSTRTAAEEAAIQSESARLDAELATEKAELERVQAKGQLEDIEHALKVAEEGVQAAQNGEKNAQTAYDLGGIPLSNLLDAKNRRAEMEEHAIQARFGRKQALVYLRYLYGLEPLNKPNQSTNQPNR